MSKPTAIYSVHHTGHQINKKYEKKEKKKNNYVPMLLQISIFHGINSNYLQGVESKPAKNKLHNSEYTRDI